jgi:polysaccharide export outer membrane protein
MKQLLVRHRLPSLVLAAAACFVAGCGGAVGPYMWVEELPAAAKDSGEFVIRETDTVNVRVYNQDSISTHERVRPDGKITVPMAGEIAVRGRKPSDISKEIEVKLKSVVVAPVVTVSVEQSAQLLIPVIGEVKNAGTFTIDPGASVLVALADAGGLTDYAGTDRIFVIRKGLDKRVRFRLSDLRDGDKRAVGFGLQSGDIVVVE